MVFAASGTTTLEHQQWRVPDDLKRIGLWLDARSDPTHGDVPAQIQANRLTIAGPVGDSPFTERFDQFFAGSRHETSRFLGKRSPVFASVQPVLMLCSPAV